jgi:hypothetical protein
MMLLCLAVPCLGQPLEGNVERLRSLADSLAVMLCRELQGWSQVQLSVEPHPARWLLEHALVQGLAACGCQLSSSTADTLPRLTIAIADVGIRYERLSADRVQRTVRWHVLATLRLPDGSLRALAPWRVAAEDTLPQAAIPQVEQPYSFASALLPESRSLWQELVEPALAIGTGAVILLLLFTLRSR